jgi:hypothetical protein
MKQAGWWSPQVAGTLFWAAALVPGTDLAGACAQGFPVADAEHLRVFANTFQQTSPSIGTLQN